MERSHFILKLLVHFPWTNHVLQQQHASGRPSGAAIHLANVSCSAQLPALVQGTAPAA